MHGDLLVAPKKESKIPHAIVATVVIIDRWTRYIMIRHVKSTTQLALTFAILKIKNRNKIKDGDILIMDLQSGLNTEFQNCIAAIQMDVEFIPKERHGKLNSYAERAIRTIKDMARSALYEMPIKRKFIFKTYKTYIYR